jgi:hypothetical protein
MMRTKLMMTILGVACWFSLAEAQYVLILKNGRQITVQSYREEGTSIKFSGLGGEIAIAKDQIQAIEKAGQSNRPGLSLPELEASSRQSGPIPQKPTPTPTRDLAQPPSSRETPPVAAAEAKEYQKRLADATQKLEAAKEKYFNATQGGGTAENVSKDGMNSWAMDLASRISDSQKVPGGGGARDTPPMSPYAPGYTAKTKELSDLRIQIDNLQKERDSLIEEMTSKNIPTGAF